MRLIATDTSDFPKLREKRCVYVDKADWKWEKYPVIHFDLKKNVRRNMVANAVSSGMRLLP